MAFFEKGCSIRGFGISEVGRDLRRGNLDLTLDAALEAVADAGLEPRAIDGLATWIVPYPGLSGPHPSEVQDALGLSTTFVRYGANLPGQLVALFDACMAVSTGLSTHVLVYKTVTQASAPHRMPERTLRSDCRVVAEGTDRWTLPFRAFAPHLNTLAMYAKRHMHEFGTRREQLGQLAVQLRKNASLNPNALYRKKLTLDDYMQARSISDPLGLFDCDAPTDGSVAFVISANKSAQGGRRPPLRIEAIGSRMVGATAFECRSDFTRMASHHAAAHMWRRTDLRPSDVDVAQLYDGFSILALDWIEAMGFCDRGEGGIFLDDARNFAIDGALPLNTGGGQLSGGRLHGLGLLHEACAQLWGMGGERQVRDPSVVAVSTGGGSIGSCALIRTD